MAGSHLHILAGNNILKNAPLQDHDAFVQLIRQAIISTDLSLYFKQRKAYFVRALCRHGGCWAPSPVILLILLAACVAGAGGGEWLLLGGPRAPKPLVCDADDSSGHFRHHAAVACPTQRG